MRYTVHAEQPRGPVEFHRATAFEAITTGRALIDAGATGLYIYDDEIDAAYWPDEFAELHAMTVAARSGDPGPFPIYSPHAAGAASEEACCLQAATVSASGAQPIVPEDP
jgi:hypothetical protein